MDLVDEAVSGPVGIVVLSGGEGTGKSLYEAARVVKSVVRDRAYFLIAERVDIASAVDASGVLLSDEGGLLFLNFGILFLVNFTALICLSTEAFCHFLADLFSKIVNQIEAVDRPMRIMTVESVVFCP